MAAAIWSQKDMRSPSGGKARHRGGTQIGKAPPWPEMSIPGLTRGWLVGEDQIARSDLPPALPDVAARPSGGLFRFWACASKDSAQITLRHRAFRTVAVAPSSDAGRQAYHGSVWGMSHSAQRGGMAIRR